MPFKDQHPLYHVWKAMRARCRNPNNRQWKDYGGRGITICDRWDSFRAFAEDMGPRPDGYSLDRIDNNGNYEPGNCRWASRKEQQRNQRRAVYVIIEGVRYRAIDLAEKVGVKTDTIVARSRKGLPMEQVMQSEELRDLSGLALGGKANGRRQRAKTHCPQGHEYNEQNTLWSKQGTRRCRTCFYAKERRRLQRKRAQKGR